MILSGHDSVASRFADGGLRIYALISAQNSARLSTAMTTTVDQKGNVALPEAVLGESGVHPGDELEASAEGENIILRKVTRAPLGGLLEILHGLKGLPAPERGGTSVRHVKRIQFSGLDPFLTKMLFRFQNVDMLGTDPFRKFCTV